MDKPCISVIMSTYNTPNDWLEQSIDSILNQTYSNFEFIIIDDCSTTDIEIIQRRYKDERIIWLKNDENIGLTKSLNKALKIARGKYIARMDADDISLPERFALQIQYMESHPKVIVCGAWRRAIGAENKNEIWNIPMTREEQQVQLFFFNCGLTHPTAMFRKSMLDEFDIIYNENYRKAQDYGMWVQCTRYAPMAMIQKVLLEYRKSNRQITYDKKSINIYDAMVKTDQLLSLGIEASNKEKEMHVAFCMGLEYENSYELRCWVDRLEECNRSKQYFEHKIFKKILYQKWYEYCKKEYVSYKNQNYKKEYQESRTIYLVLYDLSSILKQKIAKIIRYLS